jgi:site-specific recombinase XerD
LQPEDFVFTAGPLEYQAPLTSHRLTRLVRTIGERAGVEHVHPHRFRHTFAITFLRNGGNLFSLQELLGHTTLDMVRRYAHIAKVDVEAAHKTAGPVDNGRL